MDYDQLFHLYSEMLSIRVLEERIAAHYVDQAMRCPTHLCIGQEAIAVGVSSQLFKSDRVYSNHRAHGHYLAKGGDAYALIAELYGLAEGCCGGRGGSMHLIDLSVGFCGATPIVAGTVPLAAGSAWASKLRGEEQITVIYLGDGCFEEGVLHEVMNFSALHRLPILFVCENNQYSVYTQLKNRQPPRPILSVARAHQLMTLAGDGNDVLEVQRVSKTAVDHIRAGKGPAFVEFSTYRWLEHCGPFDDDHLNYRPEGELSRWREECPIERLKQRLIKRFPDQQAKLEPLRETLFKRFEAMIKRAKSAVGPDVTTLPNFLFAPRTVAAVKVATNSGSQVISYSQALLDGMQQAMASDPEVLLIGEGVPDPKAIFETTRGLQQQFGADRVFDMPLSENGITGICIGAATMGFKPVLVHQRIDFSLLSLDQVINNAAKWHYMFNGQVTVPLVIRMIIGRGWGQGPQHSQALQGLFAQIPGLKVVMPVTAEDAKGMLVAAIFDPNPVIFIEHRWLHLTTGEVKRELYENRLEGAQVVRSGTQLTLAAFSHRVVDALNAAQALAAVGVSVEVVDMRVLHQLDLETLHQSVSKTGHLIVAEPGHHHLSVGHGLLGSLLEKDFRVFKSSPKVAALPNHPTPTSHHLTKDYYPDAADLALQVLEQLSIDSDERQQRVREQISFSSLPDVPNQTFTGPF